MSRDYSLDEIGKRLSGEGLTPEEQILAADDRERVAWVRGAVAGAGNTDVIDIGASDGTLAAWWATHGHRVFTIERHDAHRERLSRLPVFAFHGEAVDALKRLPRMEAATVFCGEVLEHLDFNGALQIVNTVMTRIQPAAFIATVPNANCASFVASGRSRRDWPDHKQQFEDWALADFVNLYNATTYDTHIYPIVGTLNDSIWLGLVARRRPGDERGR